MVAPWLTDAADSEDEADGEAGLSFAEKVSSLHSCEQNESSDEHTSF